MSTKDLRPFPSQCGGADIPLELLDSSLLVDCIVELLVKWCILFSFQGVCIGMLLGFAMGLWIAIGSQLERPPVALPPRYTSGCDSSPISNMTTDPTKKYLVEHSFYTPVELQ